MTDIRIEQAQQDQALVIAALALRADLEDAASTPRVGFMDEYADAWLAQYPYRPTWLALLPDGAPVGLVSTALIHKLPSLRRPTTAWMHIALVYVVPDWRARGLGERLLRVVLGWSAEQGVERVQLNAVPQARTLYARVGFGAPGERLMQLPPGT